MRSLLFVPGNSAKMMAKAASSGADVLIFDLEDAVHPDAKPAARQSVAEALANRAGGGPARYVRVNALDSAWCMEDLEAVLPAGPDGIMLPKLMGPEDLHVLGGLIRRWELSTRRDLTQIIPVCTETPAATLSLAAKSWAHPRLAGLLWGAEDLSAAVGATTNRDEHGRYTEPFALARSLWRHGACDRNQPRIASEEIVISVSSANVTTGQIGQPCRPKCYKTATHANIVLPFLVRSQELMKGIGRTL